MYENGVDSTVLRTGAQECRTVEQSSVPRFRVVSEVDDIPIAVIQLFAGMAKDRCGGIQQTDVISSDEDRIPALLSRPSERTTPRDGKGRVLIHRVLESRHSFHRCYAR